MPYDQVMHKFKHGTLRSGGNGAPVKDRKQAVAIMLSEKRKAAAGNTEYQSKTPASHPLHKLRRKMATPSSYADGGVVQQSGMAMVHAGEKVLTPAQQKEPVSVVNARNWREHGYDQWKQGDAEREKELPPGGMAPMRMSPMEQYKRKQMAR